MGNEQKKQEEDLTHRIPYIQLDRVASDYAFALALQEQETRLTPFINDSFEEEEEEEEDEGSATEGDDDDYDEIEDDDERLEAELEDLEDEEEDLLEEEEDDEDMEEDDIDPDDLTYEDLMALGEIVGSENTGLSADKVDACLCPYSYKSELGRKYGFDQCVICQIEYEEEEPVVMLRCEHTYHSDCISKWLQIKKVCPVCKSDATSSIST